MANRRELNAADYAIRERILPFLPDRIFDAHAHLYCRQHYPDGALQPNLPGDPARLGIEQYRMFMDGLHGEGRTVGGLFFGLAFAGDRRANNDFVSSEVGNARTAGFAAYGQIIVSPESNPDAVVAQVHTHKFVGLKCYHTMAKTHDPTWEAPIEDYLPEELVSVANDHGLAITLHMVRNRALADPINQRSIRRYCTRYPNIRLILAHAARGFNPWHTIEGISSLRGLDNVWFDTSAVTEAGAFEAIVEGMGHTRLLYGTDFPVSHVRGRCVAIGDSFHWFYADDMNVAEKHTTLQPVLVGLESLRSLQLACIRLKLRERQIEDIFHNNAAQLFAGRVYSALRSERNSSDKPISSAANA